MTVEGEPKRKRVKLADDTFQDCPDYKTIIHKNIDSFHDYLDKLFTKSQITEEHSVPQGFFDVLRSYCIEGNYEAFRDSFLAFCDVHAKNFTYIYKATVFLLEIIGYDVKYTFDFEYDGKGPFDLDLTLKITVDIFEILSRVKSNEDMKINEVLFSDFTKLVVLSTIKNVEPTSESIQVIINAMETEPMIVEPLIPDVIPYLMLSNAGETTKNYKVLLLKILDVCVKLHRLPNLISKMLPAIKGRLEGGCIEKECFELKVKREKMERGKSTDCEVDYVLPEEFLEAFSQHLIGLAGWEVINLMKTFLFHLEAYVKNICEVAGDVSKHIYIEILSKMLCQFLSSVKVVEHTTQDLIVNKFVACMTDLKATLGVFGNALLEMNHNQYIMRAYLNICYVWGELYILLKTRSEQTLNGTGTTDYHLCCVSYVHPYLTPENWCLVIERVTNFGEKPCKKVMQLLQLQSIKAVYAFEETDADTNSLFCRCSLQNQGLEHILDDPFVLQVLVPRFDDDTIASLAKTVIKRASDANGANIVSFEMLNCPRVLESIAVSLLLKICRKQTDIKDLIEKITTEGDLDAIIGNTEEHIKVFKGYFESMDSKEFSKVMPCLELMEELRILSLSCKIQYAVFLCAAALLETLNCRESDGSLKLKVEAIVTELIRYSPNLICAMKPSYILNFVLTNVTDYKSSFYCWMENILRVQAKFPDNLTKTVKYLLKKFKRDEKRRTCTIVALDNINKNKKQKIYVQHKNEVSDGRDKLYDAVVDWLSNSDKNSKEYVHLYAVTLKYFVTVDDKRKNLLLETLEDVIKVAVVQILHGNLQGEILLFTTILRHKNQIKSLNNDTMLQIWTAVKSLNVPLTLRKDYSGLIMLIFEHMTNEEFSTICTDLVLDLRTTMDDTTLDRLFERLGTVKCILNCNFNPIKNKVWQTAIETILNELVTRLACDDGGLHDEVVALEEAVIETNHLMLTELMISAIFRSILTLMSRTTAFVKTYKQCATILNMLIKYRRPQMADRLPPFLALYRVLLSTLTEASDSSRNLEKADVDELADCGHQIEKLTKMLLTCGKSINGILEYIIPHVLVQYEKFSIYSSVKIHFDNCIYMLMSRLNQHSNAHLMRCLSTASAELFKYYHSNYTKHYRFTGKV